MIGRVFVVILVSGLSAAGRVTQADARSVSIPYYTSRRAIIGSPWIFTTYMAVGDPSRALPSLQPLDQLSSTRHCCLVVRVLNWRTRGAVRHRPITQFGPDALFGQAAGGRHAMPISEARLRGSFGRVFGRAVEGGGRVVMLEVGLEDRHVGLGSRRQKQNHSQAAVPVVQAIGRWHQVKLERRAKMEFLLGWGKGG